LMLGVWTYFALMSAEFFVGEWLKQRPIIYLISHMIIMPLLAWLMAAFQRVYDDAPVVPLATDSVFLLAILALGVVLEFGRKIRATADEENGVETYSSLWGPLSARNAWACTALAAAGLAVIAVAQIGGSVTVALLVVALGLAILGIAARAFTPHQPGSGKRIEQASGAQALAVLLALGLAPHVEALP